MKKRKIIVFVIISLMSNIKPTYALEDGFKDEKFYNCVVEATKTANQTLEQLTYLNCEDKQITDTSGIEKLPNLTSLNLNKNYLQTIDLSKNTKLKTLVVSANYLKELNVSQNKELTELWSSSNQLQTIDLTKNQNLEKISFYQNQLETIDVSQNTKLTEINLSVNKIKFIDLSNLLNLKELEITSNQLNELDISKNLELQSLSISHNNLKTINLTNNTKIESLTFDMSQNIDYSKLPKLQMIKNTSTNKIPVYGTSYSVKDLLNYMDKNITYEGYQVYNNTLGINYPIMSETINGNDGERISGGINTTNAKNSEITNFNGSYTYTMYFTLQFCKLTSNKYVINEEKNAIIVNEDTDEEIKKNINSLLSGVSYEINEDKLILKYEQIAFKEFTLIRTANSGGKKCTEDENNYYDKFGNSVSKEAYFTSCGLVENPKTGFTLNPIILVIFGTIAYIVFRITKKKQKFQKL